MKPLESLGGLTFDTKTDRAFMSDRGTDMVHEVGIKCPCRAEDALAAFANEKKSLDKPHCPRCYGEGWLYRDPALIQGLVSSVAYRTMPIESGWTEPGDLRFQPIGVVVPGRFLDVRVVSTGDKLTSTWSTPLEGQIIVRGAASMAGAAGIRHGLDGALEDRLWYEPDKAIWCEDEDGEIYTQGEFELGPGRLIRWSPNTRRPRDGKSYSLKYGGFLEWVVFTRPSERRDGNQDLGTLYWLRCRHVYHPNESPYITPNDRVTLKEFRP